ncbi:MAG: hypothetical protein FWC55_09380, partial [Firmicutes bacterium]|nr:hypothetical protein [Bacillota bacterium]
MRKRKVFIAMLLVIAIIAPNAQMAVAAAIAQLPLANPTNGELVANDNTRFITLFTQDPATGLITASVQVQNGNAPGGADIFIRGVSEVITFSDQVAPSDAAGNMMPDTGGTYNTSLTDFRKYCEVVPSATESAPGVPVQTGSISNNRIRNDSALRVISGLFTVPVDYSIKVAAGETVSLVKFYFMPTAGETVSLDMFGYQTIQVNTFLYLSPYFANGRAYLYSRSAGLANDSTQTYYQDPLLFKIQVQRPQPDVSADQTARTVTGYDSLTMEWSASADGPYTSAPPVIGSGAQTVYVRAAGDATYSDGGTVTEYGDYKKYVASEPVKLDFYATSETPAIDDVYAGDAAVSGTGVDGAEILVTFPGKETQTATVANGVWSVDVPAGVTLNENDIITAVQTETGKAPSEEATATVKAKVLVPSETPAIDDVYAGDAAVTGTGVDGAEILVTFPGGETQTATVTDGVWSVDVPAGVTLNENDIITAVQTETGKAPSEEVTATVK